MIKSWIHHLKRVYSACSYRSFCSKPRAAAATPTLLETAADWSSQPPAPLRGRRFLVGSGSPGVPEVLPPPREGFPPVYVPAEISQFSPEDWAVAARDVVRRVVDGGVGAALFRGLPLHTAKDFSRFANSLALKPMSYAGGVTKREKVEGNVETASDEPPLTSIEPHNEMCYTHYYPEKILFFCQRPADPGQGGETVMLDAREVLRNLDSAVVDKFRTLGIRYVRYMPENGNFFHGYNSWKETFRTDSRDDIEKYMRSRGMAWQWGEDGSLTWWHNLPAMKLYKGEWLWFCQPTGCNADFITALPDYDSSRPVPSHLNPFNSQYGDGSDIEPEVLQHIRDVTWQAAVGFQMKRRDVLVLNNMYIQHGRLGYTGDRKVLVYLAEPNA
ncbi:hypothetical protein Bbelb_431550 [Branchiostoma belcheri]|nr:hypothetical protein Bbelb_431550 [Branchiostoma belcheri]